MKLIFVETEKEGHHISLYARTLIKEFIKKNDVFLITTKDVVKSNQFKTLKPFFNKINIYNIKSEKKPLNYNFINIFLFHLKNLIRIFFKIKEINKKHKIDNIYFNHFDPFIFFFVFINFFFGLKIKVSGLLLNIKFHQYFFKIRNYSFLDTVKYYLFRIFIYNKQISKVFVIDEQFVHFLNKKNFNSKKLIKINEAFYEKKYKKNLISKKNKNKIKILLYGIIHQRKGIHLIYQINKIKKIRNKIEFTFAGKFDSKILKYIKINKKIFSNVKIVNKFINDRLEAKLIKSTDLVWLCYTSGSDGSSGVMHLAAINSKPIIYSNRGLINYIASKNKLGFKIYLEKNIIDQFESIFFKKYNLINFNNSIKKYIKTKIKNRFEKKISQEMKS